MVLSMSDKLLTYCKHLTEEFKVKVNNHYARKDNFGASLTLT